MKYYIIAGEASGDLHGSNLIRSIVALDDKAEIRYWGGDKMKQACAEHPEHATTMVKHIRDLAIMGIVEVVSHLGSVFSNISFCKKDIVSFAPDVVVFIDYPGFNLKIAKFVHARGIRNVYYISPQIWAWKKWRIRPMRRDIDKLCYILPTERDFYAKNDFPQAVYVGHPLLDAVATYKTNRLFEDCQRPVVALLPGSRRQELKRVLPLMIELAQRHEEFRFVIAGMTLIGEDFYRSMIPSGVKNIEVVYDRTYDLLASSFAAVVCSGTATLETALFNVPQVVCYQCNKLSAAIARRLISSRIKYISLVNLIADAPVVDELIQEDYNATRLEQAFQRIVADSERNTMLAEYGRVVDILEGAGASTRTATEVVKMAKNR